MKKYEIILRINFSSKKDIEDHLTYLNSEFKPSLLSYLNISDYSSKLYDKSSRFEAWDDKCLIGLIAGYENVDKFFISNLSVYPEYKELKLSLKLLTYCIDNLKSRNFRYVELEVFQENIKAINFYKRNGFILITTNGNIQVLSLSIK